MVHALTSLDDRATILSVDGVGAYDTISRNATFQGVADMVDGEKIILFIRQFYDSPLTYLWEDEVGGARAHRRVCEGSRQECVAVSHQHSAVGTCRPTPSRWPPCP